MNFQTLLIITLRSISDDSRGSGFSPSQNVYGPQDKLELSIGENEMYARCGCFPDMRVTPGVHIVCTNKY